MFKLETFEGMPMEGYYYTHELSRVRGEPLYRIESILRRNRNKTLVKFVGYDKAEYIDSRNIQNLN